MEKGEAVIKLLNIIYKNPQASPRELAKAIGKLNKLSKQIKSLIKYRVDNDNPKPITQYIKEKAKITRNFIKRKMAEYEELLGKR